MRPFTVDSMPDFGPFPSEFMISVVIPTRHRDDLLSKCLDCLAPGVQTLPGNQYEVIVTDDGSQSTAEILIREQYPWARWVAGPRIGPAANRNQGAVAARGEWLVFTDDDCLPSPEWLEMYSRQMESSAVALEGSIHPLGDTSQDMAECPVNLDGGWFWSANIAIKRSFFQEIGGFDSSYPLAAHEDQDLKIRVERQTDIVFVPLASVFHPVRKSSFAAYVKSLPKRCAAWAFHARKHRTILGYRRSLDFLIIHYRQHLSELYRQMKSHRFQSAVCSVWMLLIGMPLCFYYFSRPLVGRAPISQGN